MLIVQEETLRTLLLLLKVYCGTGVDLSVQYVRRSLKELSVFTAALLRPHTGHTLRALPSGWCLYATASAEIVCKSDLTCARDWSSDPRGLKCTGSCIPYQQMYQHGRDLCESFWGDSFVAVEDEALRVKGHCCGCINLNDSDQDVIAALRAQKDALDKLDTSKHQENTLCSHGEATIPQQGQGDHDKSVLHNRSAPSVHDSEGSGSGF